MKPNLERTVLILSQKLGEAVSESAQYQSIAEDYHGEIQQLKEEIKELKVRQPKTDSQIIDEVEN